jgi:hypothetical protein
MPVTDSVSFVAAVSDREILQNALLASPFLKGEHRHELIMQDNWTSAAKAYNAAITQSSNDLIVFAHQDIFFPAQWLLRLEKALSWLATSDPNWGVLGCWGATLQETGVGYLYSNGLGLLGEPFEDPRPVQTLDEIVLILRKSSGLRFDDSLPHFHFYGADICLSAAVKGMTSYVIPAFCIHNTQLNFSLPKEFYDAYKHLKRRWRSSLPIQTTCIRVSKSDSALYKRKLNGFYLRHVLHKEVGAHRIKDARLLHDISLKSTNPAS